MNGQSDPPRGVGAAARTRAWRARKDGGYSSRRVDVHRTTLATLIAKGIVTRADLRDPHRLAEILGTCLAEYADSARDCSFMQEFL